MKRAAFCLVATAFAMRAQAQPNPPPPLPLLPSAAWVVDYDDDSCALRRSFGNEGAQVVLEMRQFAPGSGFQVRLVGRGIGTLDSPLRVKFEPETYLYQPHATKGTFGPDAGGYIYSDSLRESLLKTGVLFADPWTDEARDARERAITGLRVDGGFARNFVLVTGELHAPMEALRHCMDELVGRWGLDLATQRALSRPVVPKDMASWARQVQMRYPSDMIRARQSAYIHIRLMVDAGGKPTACNVQLDAQRPSFSQTACAILMRYAKFDPALDAGGKPVASYFSTAILYELRT